jgi:hypothetical protein
VLIKQSAPQPGFLIVCDIPVNTAGVLSYGVPAFLYCSLNTTVYNQAVSTITAISDPGGNGPYITTVVLNAADFTSLGSLMFAVGDSSGNIIGKQICDVVSALPADVLAALTSPGVALNASQPNAVAFAAGMAITNPSGDGLAISSTGANGNAVSLSPNGIGECVQLYAAGGAGPGEGNIDGSLLGNINNVEGSVNGNVIGWVQNSNTVQAFQVDSSTSAPTTTVFETTATLNRDLFTGQLLWWISGSNSGFEAVIQSYAYTLNNKVQLTLASPAAVTPQNTDTFLILGAASTGGGGGDVNVVSINSIPTSSVTTVDAVIGTPTAGSTAAALTALQSHGDSTWATATGFAPSATALSTVEWTNARAGYLDNLSAGAVALETEAVLIYNAVVALGSPAQAGVAVVLPSIPSGWITNAGIANNAISDAKIQFPAESAGRATTFLAAMRRVWEWVVNQRQRNRSTGDVTLNNAANSSTLETQVQSTTGSIDTQTQGM